MKPAEIRAMDDDRLNRELEDLLSEWRTLRFQEAVGQLTATARIRQIRKDIARIKTIQTEREIEAELAGEPVGLLRQQLVECVETRRIAGRAVEVPDRRAHVFQHARLFPHLRVEANLRYGERLARPEERWIGRDEMVEFLGIAHLLARWPATLSGGEVRRVAIGRALLAAPRFLLLDEPFASLDPARGETLMALVERIRDELKVPILLVSHDRAEVARLAGRVVTID